MIFVKTWSGIKDHWPLRVSEWIMVLPAFGVGLALRVQDSMFSLGPSFVVVASWGEEITWSNLLLGSAVMRLMALAVNGSFSAFRYTPHIRAAASVFGAAVWSQFCLGLVLHTLNGGVPLIWPIMLGTLITFELANIYRSFVDIGAWVRRRKLGRMG